MFKILVVEDEDDIRASIVDILEIQNFDIMATSNGKEALDIINRFHPDLILSDINMPVMGGFEMLEALRKNPNTHAIPCIFLTAKIRREDFRHGMSIGADDYLTKPFTGQELISAVNTRLERYKILQSDINNQITELQLLRQMDQELSERLEPNWVIDMIFDWALRQSNASNAFLFLREDDTEQPIVRYIYGEPNDITIKVGDTLQENTMIDSVLLSGKVLLLNNVERVNNFEPIAQNTKSILAVPIIFVEQVMGVILLESDTLANFEHSTAKLLSQMANRASIALQHAKLFNKLSQQHEVESRLRTLFQKFVSEEVAMALEDEHTSTEEINTKAAILFCDIRNFTAYSENHTASEVVWMLNQYIPLVVQAARLHGGNVNKFGGDSVMIIFGTPNYMDDPSYHAIQTALQIIRSLKQLNETVLKDSDFKLNVGVGINTGEVIAGTIGSNERQEYTVIGDNVNLAARIESLNKQFTDYSIFITDYTYQDLGSRRKDFEFNDLGDIDIRGKANPIKVWAVKGYQDKVSSMK